MVRELSEEQERKERETVESHTQVRWRERERGGGGGGGVRCTMRVHETVVRELSEEQERKERETVESHTQVQRGRGYIHTLYEGGLNNCLAIKCLHSSDQKCQMYIQ